ncbi:MAG: hypothetical protein ACYTFQ_00100 [Planctomycetota bacterium]
MTTSPSITISFRDVIERRAFIRLSGEAKVKLCHKAGAPWFEKDPSAKLHSRQIEALSRKEREKIIHGGSRWGKSVLGGCEGICEAMLPWTNLAVVASRYDHVGKEWQYIYKGLKELFRNHPQVLLRLRFVNRPSQHDYDYETIWGAKGRGFSVDADEGASLLGSAFTRMIFGEGSHISQEVLEKKAMRAIDGALMENPDDDSQHFADPETGYLTIYTTPKGYEGCSAAEFLRVRKQTKNEPRKMWYGLVPFAQTIWLREAKVTENPYYSKEVYEARKNTLSRAAHQEQYDGLMTFATGRVLAEFNEDIHVIQGQPHPDLVRGMSLGIGLDTGAYFGAVLSGLGRCPDTGRPCRWKLGEAYLEQADIYTCLDAVESMVIHTLGDVFAADNFEQLAQTIPIWGIDPASQHKPEIHAYWDKYGVALMSPPGLEGGKLELEPSLDVVRSWIASGLWFVSDDCQVLLEQIRRYIWKTVKTGGQKNAPVVKEPRKMFDHLIDASRFVDFALELEGIRETPLPAMTVAAMMEQAQRNSVFGPLRAVLDEAAEMEEQHGVGIWV